MCGDSRGERWERPKIGERSQGHPAGSVSQDKEFGLHPKSNGTPLRDFK